MWVTIYIHNILEQQKCSSIGFSSSDQKEKQRKNIGDGDVY